MGYVRHHAILVTSWKEPLLVEAHTRARETFSDTAAAVSEITAAGINGYRSFFVAPDGSKEGWNDSDDADRCRDAFIGWLDSQRYDDGSTPLAWAEVQYGDEEYETKVTRDSDARARAIT